MRVSFSADDVRLDVKPEDGKLQPTLGRARDGQVLIELTRAELTGMLMAFAEAGAAQQGAKIESADLSLEQAGDRGVSGTLRIKAKKMMVTATVVVVGRAVVDERLAVTVSGLKASGDGMIGSLVAGMLDGKLKPHEGQTFELAPPALKNVRLHQLKVDAADPVRLTATFES